MKAHQILALAGISLLAMSNSCEKEGDVSPTADLTIGRLVRMDMTIDNKGQNSRPRWVVDIAPVSLEGPGGKSYQQAKVFNLPDTATYKAGQVLTFHYQVVPSTQQTPWKTLFEWDNTQQGLVGTEPLAEISCSEIKAVPPPKSN